MLLFISNSVNAQVLIIIQPLPMGPLYVLYDLNDCIKIILFPFISKVEMMDITVQGMTNCPCWAQIFLIAAFIEITFKVFLKLILRDPQQFMFCVFI